MLTPRFELSQTDDKVTILIHAPYANVTETEVSVEKDIFLFYSQPYYLRLHLPGAIEETEESSGKYDSEKGDFTFVFNKETKGEHFPNLDFGTLFLTPSKTLFPPQIEVIGESECTEEDDDCEECFDWYIDQNISEENLIDGKQPRYGFADEHSGVFTNLQWEAAEILDLPQPDTIPVMQRSSLKYERELADFNSDHYFADMMECEVIEPYMKYKVPWHCKEIKFTDAELDIIKELPRREYLLSKEQRKILYLGLVDILGAYCYNRRTTLGEDTVESAWTINKISGTLSWFNCFTDLKDVVVSVVRRCLCYPLYRNWELAMQIIGDLKELLSSGKKHILRCLLEIRSLFNKSEPRFLLNKLYITDYCVWTQGANEKIFLSLAKNIDQICINKNDVIPELTELEAAAWLVVDEEENTSTKDEVTQDVLKETLDTESHLTGVMAGLTLNESTKDTNTEDSSSSNMSDEDCKENSDSYVSDGNDSEGTQTLDSDDDDNDDTGKCNNENTPLDSDDDEN